MAPVWKTDGFTGIFSVTAVDSQLEPSVGLNHATGAKFEGGLGLVSCMQNFLCHCSDVQNGFWMMESCHWNLQVILMMAS